MAPATDGGKICAIVFILLGISLVATSLGALIGYIEGAASSGKPLPRPQRCASS